MKQLPNIELLKESLSATKKALVLMGANPNLDVAAGALGFALALKKKGIETQVVSLSPMRVEFSRLVGVDSVRNKVGNRNLVVSFEYSENQVEKVSYNISEDGKRFNLVIAPRSGSSPLQPETMQFDLVGAEAQFIACFGINSAEELDEMVKNEHGLMDGAMSVALTAFPSATFAKVHLDAQTYSSLSELTVALIRELGLETDEDSGSNLLAGIDLTTNGFRSPLVSADTFELVAFLMRQGGVRPPVISAPPMTPSQMPFVPGIRRPFPQAPAEAGTNQFARMLGNSAAPKPNVPLPPDVAPTPQFPGEFKG